MLVPSAETLWFATYLSLFSQLGVLTRIYVDKVFNDGCSESWGLCLTSSGTHSLAYSSYFVDLPSNMIGCFILGLLAPSESLCLTPGRAVAILPASHPLQRNHALLTGLRTGFCGSLTTLSAWLLQMATMIFGGRGQVGAQWGQAAWGLLVGFQLSFMSLLLGEHAALAISCHLQGKEGACRVPVEAPTPEDGSPVQLGVSPRASHQSPAFADAGNGPLRLAASTRMWSRDGACYPQSQASAPEDGALGEIGDLRHDALQMPAGAAAADTRPPVDAMGAVADGQSQLVELPEWRRESFVGPPGADVKSRGGGQEAEARGQASLGPSDRDIHPGRPVGLAGPSTGDGNAAERAGGSGLQGPGDAGHLAVGLTLRQLNVRAVESGGGGQLGKLWEQPFRERLWRQVPHISAALLLTGLTALWVALVITDKAAPRRGHWLAVLAGPPGCLLRWRLAALNGRLPLRGWGWLPAGTLAANMLACGASYLAQALSVKLDPGYWPMLVLAAVRTGFAGSLSTVSTFVAEVRAQMRTFPATFHGYTYAGVTFLLCCLLSLPLYSWSVYTQ